MIHSDVSIRLKRKSAFSFVLIATVFDINAQRPPAPSKSLAAAAPQLGRVTGFVMDDGARPVRDARITADLLPSNSTLPNTTKSPVRRYRMIGRTLGDGSYALSLPPGRYRLCPQAAVESLLNPCLWEEPRVVVVAAGQPVVAAPHVLATGNRLALHLSDPGRYLEQHLAKTPGANLHVGLYNGFHDGDRIRVVRRADAESRSRG